MVCSSRGTSRAPRISRRSTQQPTPRRELSPPGTRLGNIQIGYTLPPAFIRWVPVARIYVQAENLFTLTGYNGLDPSLPTAGGATGTGLSGEDIRDQYRGVDRGSYPTSRIFTVGITTNF